MKGEAQAVQQAGRWAVQRARLAPADEATARAEDEMGTGLSLLWPLNPHLCFPLFLLGREKEKNLGNHITHKQKQSFSSKNWLV